MTSKHIDYIAEAIKYSFGDRCPEHADGCAICEAWKQYDGLRAVPDVPELVRYDLDFHGLHGEDAFMNKIEDGEYVRYDQAAEMIANLINELSSFRSSFREQTSLKNRAEAAEAELAQIKAQEPVAWSIIFSSHYGVNPETTFKTRERAAAYLSGDISGTVIPLYAAPVDQAAEIERLREALEFYADGINNRIAREALSGKDPS